MDDVTVTDDIVVRLRAAALSGDLTLGQSFDCTAVADEIDRLRDIIKQAAELLDSYGDGGTVWTEEMDIINMVQKEARRG